MTRVVVTGLGLWTPLGGDVRDNWNALNEPSPRPSPEKGEGGCLPSPFSGESARRAGEGFEGARKMAEAAALEALTDAGLWDGEQLLMDPERAGCTVSISKPLFSGVSPLPADGRSTAGEASPCQKNPFSDASAWI